MLLQQRMRNMEGQVPDMFASIPVAPFIGLLLNNVVERDMLAAQLVVHAADNDVNNAQIGRSLTRFAYGISRLAPGRCVIGRGPYNHAVACIKLNAVAAPPENYVYGSLSYRRDGDTRVPSYFIGAFSWIGPGSIVTLDEHGTQRRTEYCGDVSLFGSFRRQTPHLKEHLQLEAGDSGDVALLRRALPNRRLARHVAEAETAVIAQVCEVAEDAVE